MMMTKKPAPAASLPEGANELVDVGHCGSDGSHHVLALRDGVPVATTHMRPIGDGQPIPRDCDVYMVERETGKIAGSMRMGNGPAQVSTEQYRDNYETVFGRKELN